MFQKSVNNIKLPAKLIPAHQSTITYDTLVGPLHFVTLITWNAILAAEGQAELKAQVS